MSTTDRDSSGIVVPPPLAYVVGFGAGYLLHRIVPIRISTSGPWRVPGWALIASGGAVMLSALVTFRRAGTTPNPTKPAAALALGGPYRFTRNPMYLGWVLAYVGGALLVNAVWPLLLLPVVIAVVQRMFIEKEERYLEQKFGEGYRRYKARVRRWI
jgi:protein-S-isoprenylcysteine O-methyltransferase Ste14